MKSEAITHGVRSADDTRGRAENVFAGERSFVVSTSGSMQAVPPKSCLLFSFFE